MTDSSNQLLTAWRDKFQQDVECVREYLSKCPYAEYTQIDDVYDDGDVYVLTVGMAVRKDELTKFKVRPRSEVEKLVTDFVEENKISATYGKDSEGLFVVNFVVDEGQDDDA